METVSNKAEISNSLKSNGHYSLAAEANGFVFTSVQLGVNHQADKSMAVGDQFITALDKTGQILAAAGSGIPKIIKVTIYLSDISYWAEIDSLFAVFFGDHKPARGVIAVKELHLGAKVGVEVIAIR